MFSGHPKKSIIVCRQWRSLLWVRMGHDPSKKN